MKRANILIIFIAILTFLSACKSNLHGNISNMQYNDEKIIDEIVTKEYDINELRSYFRKVILMNRFFVVEVTLKL